MPGAGQGKSDLRANRGAWQSGRYLLFGFAAGAMLPVQFGINAQLAEWVGSPLRATLVSFAVGTLVLLVAAARVRARLAGLGARRRGALVGVGGRAARRLLRARLGRDGAEAGRGDAGGGDPRGAGDGLPRVDHFGWVGFDENPVTPGRLAGMALVAAGVALVRVF